MARKQCAYCGEFVGENVKQCPNCREAIPDRVEIRKGPAAGGTEIRRGLLYMLLGATLYYFASPGSPLPIPFPVPPVVTRYLLPLLFLSGLGFALFGGLRRIGLF
ncbi:MAG: hypothetical protein HYR58_03060 [Acidobacteria bacterium]|nr:hypothetical protein [Acidobacteriota bacterium]MBI3484522.1 hypothetical protein [Acidobacteriota bacterium]